MKGVGNKDFIKISIIKAGVGYVSLNEPNITKVVIFSGYLYPIVAKV
jgi:hypothetical protein